MSTLALFPAAAPAGPSPVPTCRPPARPAFVAPALVRHRTRAHVAVLSLESEPFVPGGWRALFAQHVGGGRYQVLASAVLSARTRALAVAHARGVAGRLTAYQQQYGRYVHPHPLPLLVPFVPCGFL